jgi:hypothetical protein
VTARNPCEHGECPNQAVISVGANGQFHLCRDCAALPEFRRYRVRKTLSRFCDLPDAAGRIVHDVDDTCEVCELRAAGREEG